MAWHGMEYMDPRNHRNVVLYRPCIDGLNTRDSPGPGSLRSDQRIGELHRRFLRLLSPLAQVMYAAVSRRLVCTGDEMRSTSHAPQMGV